MEATPEQAAEGLAIVRVLASVLDRLVITNAPLARADPGQVTKFHAMKAPGISIQQYLERIHQYASCSNECFILALIYIDRLIQRNNFLLTELNVHRVVITAVLLAAKFFDDAYYNNAYYAKVGGVLPSELNGLEVDFLFRVNFSLHVTPDEFEKYRIELLSHATLNVVTPPFEAEQPPAYMQAQVHYAPSIPQNTVECAYANYTAQQLANAAAEVVSQMAVTDPTYNMIDDSLNAIAAIVAQNNGICNQNETQYLHRSNSMPPLQVKSPLRIQQPASAPICPQPMGSMPQFPTNTRQVAAASAFNVVIDNQNIFPIQGKLVHHQHGIYHQQDVGSYVVNARDVVASQQPQLAGFSGVGM